MNTSAATGASVVNENLLSSAVQDRLNAHRVELKRQFQVADLQFSDGAWRAIVTTDAPVNGDYAAVFAVIEEELFDAHGLNIFLVPTTK